ncbi:response regulator transcription factor [Halarcobacter ebronensis]|uniref:DNA-binding response regulator n=1 Tax=Halarcobacter ebronensis TaxID=1462615 RepID=A0A4Q1AKJ2_9BACT|nr:response regulator [Halarcobacter ebronensis]QKF83122.1 two-component system response regulator [Halarcobacter ebronensis]RXK05240.1 hypothetical protein CRV07_09500 [Halarcobacter ebronensis]
MFENLTVLYAEDEDFIRENVVEALEFMRINVIAVKDGYEAYVEYLKQKPNIIITDIEMPGMNGLELAEKIRKVDNKTPIVITTAYTNVEYFLKAVELQLIKYLLKPITLIDLKNTLNKCIENLKDTTSIISLNSCSTYDLYNHILIVEGKEKKLDAHERQLLELLLKYRNHVVSYEQIESTIWEDGMSNAALRSLVRNLRQKLPEDIISNISKMGYRIDIK